MSGDLRAPGESDIPAIVRLASKHSPEPHDEEALRSEWTAPRVDLERDARVEGGAYVLVERLDDERVWLDVQGAPSPELLDWAEARAAELASMAFSGAWSTDRAVLDALESRGFRPARHSLRMLVDLDGRMLELVWPAGVDVRTFSPGDERVFYDVHQETFGDSTGMMTI